jgi:NADH dehydrogenase
VLTRDPRRAADLVATGTEIVVGDARDPASVRDAVAGVDTVVSAMHGFLGRSGDSPETVDHRGNATLVEAAEAVGADVVLVSVVGASPDSPFELFRAKSAAERQLRASGVAWTVVRASAFLETWNDLLRTTSRRSGRPVVFGRGDNPINFVSVDDVADVVARVALDHGSRGTVVEVLGPEDLTLCELADRLAADEGLVSPPRRVPRAAVRLLGGTVGRVRPDLRRQAHAALAMDTADLAGVGATNR